MQKQNKINHVAHCGSWVMAAWEFHDNSFYGMFVHLLVLSKESIRSCPRIKGMGGGEVTSSEKPFQPWRLGEAHFLCGHHLCHGTHTNCNDSVG